MDIMELGAIGELVGAVVVIGSLLYLALQVRQGTEQTRQTNLIERGRANREMQRGVNEIYLGAVDSEIQRIYSAALIDFNSISNHDKALLHHRFLIPMGVHSTSTFLAAKEGLVDGVWAEGWLQYWVQIIKSPGLSVWWDDLKPYFQPEFSAEVEKRRLDPDGPLALTDMLPWLLSEPSRGQP